MSYGKIKTFRSVYRPDKVIGRKRYIMNLFEENMISMEKKYPYACEKIKQIDIKDVEKKAGVEQTLDGNIVLFQIFNNRKWYLNSRLEPDVASQIYADRYKIYPYGIYFIFGFSDGKSIRNLLKKCDDTNLLIISIPDIELFTAACYCFDLTDIIGDDRVHLHFEELETDAGILVESIVDYTRIKLVEFCILPSYDVLYHEACGQLMDMVLEQMRLVIVNKSTYLTFNRSIPQSMLSNMKRMIKHRNIKQLQDMLYGKDLKEVPVIIVSAGPSLDKNIHLLKEAQGKALIIAVDASIRTVLQAGVRPDLLCSIDPNSPERFFTGLDLDDVYWTCGQVSSPVLLQGYGKHIFYYGSYGRIWDETLEAKLQYDFPKIATGGSVSTEAFMLALYLGFRKIILIGQDLAFTNGITHTKGAKVADNDAYIKKRHLVEVEGIDGIMLQTDFQMWFYKQWFEKVIRKNKGMIQVIDATEGGAKIEGAQIMSLREVIDTYCKHEINIYDMEQKIPTMFSEEQQKELQKNLKDIKNDILEFQATIDDIIEKQEKIRIKIKRNNNSVQVTNMLRKLTELNQKIDIEKTPILDYITLYATNEEYEVGEDIYAAENLTPVQLVEKSLTLLKGYQKGAKLFLEDFENIILNDED